MAEGDDFSAVEERQQRVSIPTVYDELRSIQPHVIKELKWAHGVAGSQLHGSVNVLLGCIA